ncbi:YpiF family protein [Domibacillus robiginosus]|uniref:YpiF family protein n=1 Tax=Domibacillus robiginosus TaxID=1071054 RepID=UPI00067E2D42|nr:YpiF family protein [Domibacillus robiginosus]
MNWNGKDAVLVEQQKQYIDTVIIPLVPVDFGAEFKRSAEQYEFVGLLADFLERQFKGRIVVTPPYAYVPETADKAPLWSERAQLAGFKHVFFLTSDPAWRQSEDELQGAVIFVPPVPLGDMEESIKRSLIADQAKQLVNRVVDKWQENFE